MNLQGKNKYIHDDEKDNDIICTFDKSSLMLPESKRKQEDKTDGKYKEDSIKKNLHSITLISRKILQITKDLIHILQS